MRTDDHDVHYTDCIFCGQEWVVSRFVKEPYACPYCRAMYKNFKPIQKRGKKYGCKY